NIARFVECGNDNGNARHQASVGPVSDVRDVGYSPAGSGCLNSDGDTGLFTWILALGCAFATPPPPSLGGGSSPFGLDSAPAVEVDPFAWDATGEPVVVGGDGRVTLRLVVPPTHFVYKDSVSISVVAGGELSAGPVILPVGVVQADVAGDLPDREQYGADVFMTVPLSAPLSATAGLQAVVLEVRHQGCRPGLCFPPTTTQLTALVPVRAAD
ncbi:MAG: hypothetical protein ACJARS_003972, partial [bacterium]